MFRVRSSIVLVAVVAAAPSFMAAQSSPAAQAQTPAPATPGDQPPVFRAGVEVLPLDVTVLDRDGRQVVDLTAAEFMVEVDGKARRVVSAEYIRLTDALAAGTAPRGPAPVVAPPPPPDYGISTNGGGGPQGRAILLLVDQGNIRFGAARPVMQNALKFLDRLQPNDRVGLVAIPGPGELVDFTTDRGKLREAMLRVAGRVTPQPRRFNISVTEAFAIYRRSDATLITQVIMRECAGIFGAADAERCERDVEQEASEIIGDQRQQTDRSVAGIRAVLQSLSGLEGQKSVILISEGLVLETLGGELDDLAAIAADVRASLDVMLLDVALFDASQAQRPTTAADDRRLQEEGLMMLAGMARGTLHRVVSSADTAFRRVEQALGGYYLLGVEPGTSDRDGRRHKIEVKTARKGVTLQARRAFLSPEGPPAASPADALKRTLRSPTPATALPIRASTWTYKEPGSSRVRLVVAAEVERATDDPLQYATGLVIATREGQVVAASEDTRDLTPITGDETRATYAGVITVEPGTYRMRVALADSEKRAGSLEREVQAWQLNGDALTLGDLLVAPEPPAGGAVAPQVEPRIHNGTLVALAEAYTPPTGVNSEVTARLEILRDESSRPIVASPLSVVVGTSPEVRVARGRISVSAVPPGAYLARVSFTEAGAARGALIRPFRVLPPAAAGGVALPGAGAPADLTAAILASLPAATKDDVLDAGTTAALWTAVEQGRTPPVLAAIKTARSGQMTDGALEALAAGDQGVAAFVRGMDLLGKSQVDQAATQFQTAMRIQGGFSAARAMLGVCLLMANREKEAAGLLMSVPPGTVPVFARLAGEAWLKSGQPSAAVTSLEQLAAARSGDARATRDLALAYALAGDAGKALPLLSTHLAGPGAKDGPAMAAGVYALYRRHAAAMDVSSITADRAQARAWARAYAGTKGPLAPIVEAWAAHLDGLK
ncbi:MAG: VWA domain-containing protein [Acidobacteria bacterium]|nr:VWA domain-containing protein [Acidobacteriota bacterium]